MGYFGIGASLTLRTAPNNKGVKSWATTCTSWRMKKCNYRATPLETVRGHLDKVMICGAIHLGVFLMLHSPSPSTPASMCIRRENRRRKANPLLLVGSI